MEIRSVIGGFAGALGNPKPKEIAQVSLTFYAERTILVKGQ